MVGTYEALLWLCEWNLGEQRGKRAKGEHTGSLNRVFFTDLRPFSRIQGLFGDSGPFRGFGNFSGIQGLFQGFGPFFGDSWPFSGIRGLFQGFAAFAQIRSLFVDLRPFSGIRGLFADSRPFSGIRSLFADSRIHSQQGEQRERTSHLAKLSLPDIYLFRFTIYHILHLINVFPSLNFMKIVLFHRQLLCGSNI